MDVFDWGGGLAEQLPDEAVNALGLRSGDNIVIQVSGACGISIGTSPRGREPLPALRKYRGRLPLNFKFERLGTNERN